MMIVPKGTKKTVRRHIVLRFALTTVAKMSFCINFYLTQGRIAVNFFKQSGSYHDDCSYRKKMRLQTVARYALTAAAKMSKKSRV